MPRLWIDNQEVEVPAGATVLDAARKLGIEIPTLCHLPGPKPATSCMVCVVKVEGSDRLVPSCAAPAADGMRVASDTDEVRQARRSALELLLGDHLGDCMAPCHSVCPCGMNVPRMIRQIAAGRLAEAVATVKEQIALPAVLGRICHRPCEKACRRAQHDAPVAICLLKRYAADADLARGEPYMPATAPASGKQVVVVGSGPAGLAAAYYLRCMGHDCTVIDSHDEPGGTLRSAVSRDDLPLDVLDAEIGVIRRLGATFRMAARVGRDVSMADLRRDFDAVLVAAGEPDADEADPFGLAQDKHGIAADKRTLETSVEGVFAAGGAVRAAGKVVRAVADGRRVADSIDQYLRGRPVTGPARPFTVHIGKLMEGEIESFLPEAPNTGARVEPAGDGLADAEAKAEALRCLHCDCRKADDCRLRDYCELYEARPGQFKGDRRRFAQDRSHPQVIYEPGKCISCGICVRLSAEAGEPLGLTFVNRGFNTRVTVPFTGSLADGLTTSAAQCVAACPTGALALKEAP